MTESLCVFSLQAKVESAISSTFYHPWITPVGQEERSTKKRKEKASWLSKVELSGGWWDLFSWLDPGPWGMWLQSGLQVGFIGSLKPCSRLA